MGGAITDVPGILIGHYTDALNATGCTAVLCDPPAVAGIDVRGAAPGSRETELLHPLATAQRVNGVMLSGGSVFGLESAAGAVHFLEERGTGIRFGRATIPLVPAAIIFDLDVGAFDVRPGPGDGYRACGSASGEVAEGSVGAGTGATVGKLRGMGRAVKGGLGTESVDLGDGVVVGALIVVNSLGGIVDPESGEIVAGPRVEASGSSRQRFEDSVRILIEDPPRLRNYFSNTVIGVVATSAVLDRRGAARLAGAGQDAIALAVRPAHTANDGDTIFTLATGKRPMEVHEDRLRAAATKAVTGAILRAVHCATSLAGIPCASEVLAGD